MRIFLVGFMGAGKTSVGKELARRLVLPFWDLDEIVEREAGASIKEIFEHEGEAGFRRRERDALLTVQSAPEAVVATGGGTFAVPENAELIGEAGMSVWLSPSFHALTMRVAGKQADRPMFKNASGAFDLYSRRLPFYRRADVILEIGDQEDVGEVVERLVLLLPRRG